ncbi:class I SAM-dependent DNA methyltransferase [Calidifontibacter terrae]
MTSSDYWDAAAAERYDESSAEMFTPQVLDPVIDRLTELAAGGPVLELASGTGRVTIPLADNGIKIDGIELSQPMTDALHAKRPQLPVVVGDMASATAPGVGTYSLVFLVFNTIANLRTQEEQVACFRNAARHLRPGGRFLIELWIPGIRRFPPGQAAVPFHVSDDHTGLDTYDPATQRGTSHHYSRTSDGSFRYGTSNFRYLWPSECDLMAQLAGLEFESRHADWHGFPFTGDSENHVSVWRKPM